MWKATNASMALIVSLRLLSPFMGHSAEPLRSGIDTTNFDRTVRIQDDLFLHVNGNWLRHTPIPDDKSNYGSFAIVADTTLLQLREIIESAAASSRSLTSDERKVGDFYYSFMDEAFVEQCGLQPLQPYLDAIDRIDSIQGLVSYWGELQSIGVTAPLHFYVDQDDKNSTRHIATVIQGGTTLPDRDYYLENTSKYIEARDALGKYVTKLFELSGLAGGEPAAKAVLQIETQLATVQWPRTELRNADKRYNKQHLVTLIEQHPGIAWQAFLKTVGVGEVTEINASTPSFFKGLEEILAKVSVDEWKQYLRFHIIDAAAPFLPASFVSAHFDLHSTELADVPEQKPRWKRAVELTAGAGAGDFGVLGDLVGRLYVRQHFTPATKGQVDTLVKNLLKAYEISIQELEWMSPETRQRALDKLAKMGTKIGHTELWRDYSTLAIRRDDLLGNIFRSQQVEHRRMLCKLEKPVDRSEWNMTPQTVNAYYNPGLNEIVFPAAILQPPFFDATVDSAVNYGGIGAVIGHEISHGFDDQGSKYDGDGNLMDWWSDVDRMAFSQLTHRLVAQFNQYEPLPGKTVNGEFTLGENIADLSGLAIALKAYHLSLSGQQAPVIDNWTGDQRFFIGWAQVWRRKYRDAEMARRLLTDPHSPSHYRANGPAANLDAFYDAFQVTPDDRLFLPREDRIRIW